MVFDESELDPPPLPTRNVAVMILALPPGDGVDMVACPSFTGDIFISLLTRSQFSRQHPEQANAEDWRSRTHALLIHYAKKIFCVYMTRATCTKLRRCFEFKRDQTIPRRFYVFRGSRLVSRLIK